MKKYEIKDVLIYFVPTVEVLSSRKMLLSWVEASLEAKEMIPQRVVSKRLQAAASRPAQIHLENLNKSWLQMVKILQMYGYSEAEIEKKQPNPMDVMLSYNAILRREQHQIAS